LPPSSDRFGKPSRDRRKPSALKPGKQPGAPGSTLELVADPDEVLDHVPAACHGCGGDLADAELVAAAVIGVDETTLNVAGTKQWLRVARTDLLTAYHLHTSRGRKGRAWRWPGPRAGCAASSLSSARGRKPTWSLDSVGSFGIPAHWLPAGRRVGPHLRNGQV
jgi:hypothetical protein